MGDIFLFYFFNFGSCFKDRLRPLGMFFWYVSLQAEIVNEGSVQGEMV